MVEEKIGLRIYFLLAGLVIIIFFNSKNIDPSQALLVISGILLISPLTLLVVLANPSVRNRIKNYYRKEQSRINHEISIIRKGQGSIFDIEKLIELDEEILSKREMLRGVQSDRFEKSSVKSLVFFLLTMAVFYFSLGNFIGINNRGLGTILFLFGLYYLFVMIHALVIAFKSY